jgi:Co/Zn/Cd efflux system component
MADVASMAFTLLLLFVWLLVMAVAWQNWTTRTHLESGVLLVLAAGVLGMVVSFVRAVFRHRRRWEALVERGEWRQATVIDIGRGFDPRGIDVGVPYRWIITATAEAPDGSALRFQSAPVRRLRDVHDLIGRRVWVRLDPADPTCHVLLPVPAA